LNIFIEGTILRRKECSGRRDSGRVKDFQWGEYRLAAVDHALGNPGENIRARESPFLISDAFTGCTF